MNLTVNPEIVTRPEAHYVFLERVGPFLKTAPQAWQDLHRLAPAISKHNQITGAMALYKIGPKIFRAGFSLSSSAAKVAAGCSIHPIGGWQVQSLRFDRGLFEFARSIGPRVVHGCRNANPLRDDFAVENYLNDPKTTPEEQLITEILVPTA